MIVVLVKRLLIGLGICGVLIILLLTVIAIGYLPSTSARRAWKNEKVAEISARFSNAWPSNELIQIKSAVAANPDDSNAWLSDRLIVMKNGEWLAYANICQKENRRINDLFLARGSDGRWYYSTYHFCIGMVVLRMEEQSEDLSSFTRTYFLKTFDVRSDECLQKTWPTESR